MTPDQVLISLILLATVALFLWGRWRHDMVALGSLLACVLAGLVPATGAFAGFGHPAVVTVAAVLVLSRALQRSGAVDALARAVLPARAGVFGSLAALVGLGALLSSFMNNVGAMALLMPVAMQLARRVKLAPGQVLMPLAFGTILGGMTTLIGTPPNLIVAGFREQLGGGGFGMFDYAPVGVPVALAGVAMVVLAGWRLVPARAKADLSGFESGAYITEARVVDGAKAAGLTLRELDALLDDGDAQVIGLVRNEVRLVAPNPRRRVRVGDILVLEAEAEALAGALSRLGLKLEEAVKPEAPAVEAADAAGADDAAAGQGAAPAAAEASAGAAGEMQAGQGAGQEDGGDNRSGDGQAQEQRPPRSGEVALAELAVLPGSVLAGRTASELQLRSHHGLNLLAISRQGQRLMRRLRAAPLRSGDLLLMQGPPEALAAFAAESGCVPLAERELRIPNRRRAWTAGVVMALAVGAAAFGLLPAAVAFAAGVLATMALRTLPLREVYTAVDWPVVVLLAALIPVAGAMESSGTAGLLARALLDHVALGSAVGALVLILLVSMFLSDVMNNAATAAVMCPIAIGTAAALGASADAFLMAVAIGASCAFLTPIGHQNNTLILGPGGFRFGDYWRLGAPLELLVVLIAVPMLLLMWPL